MLFFQNLAILLAHVHFFLVPLAYSAPSIKADSRSPPLQDGYAQLATTPPATNSRKEDTSVSNIRRRADAGNPLRDWPVYNQWLEAIKSQHVEFAIPDGIPIGERKTRSSLSWTALSNSRYDIYEWTKVSGDGRTTTSILQLSKNRDKQKLNSGELSIEGAEGQIDSSPSFLVRESPEDTNLAAKLLNSLILQKRIDDPNVVKVYDYFRTEGTKKKRVKAFGLLEWTSPIGVADYIGRNFPDRTRGWWARGSSQSTEHDKEWIEEQMKINRYFLMMLEGVQAAHRKGIMLGNLSPNSFKEDLERRLKLTQFDQATDSETSNLAVGINGYVAPENLLGEPPDDVYSMTMLLLRITYQNIPLLRFWRATVPEDTVNPNWLGPDDMKARVFGEFDFEVPYARSKVMSSEIIDILSKGVCGPDERMDIDMFVTEMEQLIIRWSNGNYGINNDDSNLDGDTLYEDVDGDTLYG